MLPLTPERLEAVTLTGRFVELRPLTHDDTEALGAVGLNTEAKPGGWLASSLSLGPGNRRPDAVVTARL